MTPGWGYAHHLLVTLCRRRLRGRHCQLTIDDSVITRRRNEFLVDFGTGHAAFRGDKGRGEMLPQLCVHSGTINCHFGQLNARCVGSIDRRTFTQTHSHIPLGCLERQWRLINYCCSFYDTFLTTAVARFQLVYTLYGVVGECTRLTAALCR